jgi:LPXTG-site transpeptidase (sortase) family protein
MLVLTRRLARAVAAAALAASLAAAAPAGAVAPPPDATPAPSRQPTWHPSQSSGAVVGRIVIPAIGVAEVIRSGVAIEVIDRGVAHWAGTAGAGEAGNMVLAGHRSTHGAPFRDLDDLRPGDLVIVTDGSGFPVMYRVDETIIVSPEDIWITYDMPGRSLLTLFACHPEGSARQRIVVRASLVAGRMIT